MLPLCTERPAYDQCPYTAAAKLPVAHRHKTVRGHSVVHGQRTIFPVPLKQPTPYYKSLKCVQNEWTPLRKIVNYIKSGALSFSGRPTSVS